MEEILTRDIVEVRDLLRKKQVSSVELTRFYLERISRYDGGLIRMHNMFLGAVEDEFGITRFNPEELIDVRVHFIADLLAGLQAHQHELTEFPCVYHGPEILV